jgi:colicin import membrane protein
MATPRKSGAKKTSKKATKRATKKATKRGAKKSAKRGAKKRGAKKSAKKSTRRASAGPSVRSAAQKARGAAGDITVVAAAKIKQVMKNLDMRTDNDLVHAVNVRVQDMLTKAAERAQENQRDTVQPHDL